MSLNKRKGEKTENICWKF